jgi:hypothetical protein
LLTKEGSTLELPKCLPLIFIMQLPILILDGSRQGGCYPFGLRRWWKEVPAEQAVGVEIATAALLFFEGLLRCQWKAGSFIRDLLPVCLKDLLLKREISFTPTGRTSFVRY